MGDATMTDDRPAADGSNDSLDDVGGSWTAHQQAIASVALSQLRHERGRTLLAVLGVVLAVLATTLLAGTGIGVVETGQEKFDQAGRDLWIVGGPVEFAPGQLGGVRGGLTDAHELQRDLNGRESVGFAAPLLFRTVYVSPNGSDFDTVAGVGVASSNGIGVSGGEAWSRDTHYAGGSYDGNYTREVVVDRRVAHRYNLSVGDRLYVGGTVAGARDTPYTVVGYSSTTSQFLGVPTVAVPLSELQEMTGSSGTDPATIVTIRLAEGANVEEVERAIQADYPQYDVRTNREQLQATIERQAVVLAGGVSLVVLAVIAGLALTLNVQLSSITRRRRAYATLVAVGCSWGFVRRIVLLQALVVGIVGAIVGVALTLPLAAAVDAVATAVTGFEGVVQVPVELAAVGAGVAVITSVVSGLVAGRRASGTVSDQLRRE
jgi:putative ABC transport system permease protein